MLEVPRELRVHTRELRATQKTIASEKIASRLRYNGADIEQVIVSSRQFDPVFFVSPLCQVLGFGATVKVLAPTFQASGLSELARLSPLLPRLEVRTAQTFLDRVLVKVKGSTTAKDRFIFISNGLKLVSIRTDAPNIDGVVRHWVSSDPEVYSSLIREGWLQA